MHLIQVPTARMESLPVTPGKSVEAAWKLHLKFLEIFGESPPSRPVPLSPLAEATHQTCPPTPGKSLEGILPLANQVAVNTFLPSGDGGQPVLQQLPCAAAPTSLKVGIPFNAFLKPGQRIRVLRHDGVRVAFKCPK